MIYERKWYRQKKKIIKCIYINACMYAHACVYNTEYIYIYIHVSIWTFKGRETVNFNVRTLTRR